MPDRLKIKGRCFGPLQVISKWGSRNGNISWVYWCRSCGHIGKKLGTHLVNGRGVRCPVCRERFKPRRITFQAPTEQELAAFFAKRVQPGPGLSWSDELREGRRLLTNFEGSPLAWGSHPVSKWFYANRHRLIRSASAQERVGDL